MAKDYSWWMTEFHQSLPVYLSDWWCKSNLKKIESECKRLGMKDLLSFTGGSVSQEAIAKWLVQRSTIPSEIIKSLQKSNPFMKDFEDILRVQTVTTSLLGAKKVTTRRSLPLEYRLEIVLTAYVKKTSWYEENISSMRKEGRKLSAIKSVMES